MFLLCTSVYLQLDHNLFLEGKQICHGTPQIQHTLRMYVYGSIKQVLFHDNYIDDVHATITGIPVLYLIAMIPPHATLRL